MSSRMLRSEFWSEILDLPVPSRHGKERCLKNKKEIIPLELVQYYQYSKCISFARAHLPGLPPCMQAKRYWWQLRDHWAMIDAVSQCPQSFHTEGSWCSGTMTSSSCSISLHARDFYAGLPSRLCVEKKWQLKQIESIFFLCQPTTWYQATG